jgi:hypothetical protein
LGDRECALTIEKDNHADLVLLNLLEEEIGEVSNQMQPYEIRTIGIKGEE